MSKSITEELASTDPKDIVSKMLLTLGAEAEKSARRSLDDTVAVIKEMHSEVSRKSLDDGDPELVELLERVRGKLMGIWTYEGTNGPSIPIASKKALDEFVDMLLSMSKNKKVNLLDKVKTLKDMLVTAVQTMKFINTLTKEAEESARTSVRDTGAAMAELQKKMEKKSASSDGKPEMEELRDKLLETWVQDTTAHSPAKAAVDEFVDALIVRSTR